MRQVNSQKELQKLQSGTTTKERAENRRRRAKRTDPEGKVNAQKHQDVLFKKEDSIGSTIDIRL